MYFENLYRMIFKKQIFRLFFASILVAMVFSHTNAQEEQRADFTNVGVLNLTFGYGIELPFGDLADRFGSNLKFAVGIEKINRKNWIYGLEFNQMFGNNVVEDVLEPLRLENLEVLGADSDFADVFIRQRGLFLGAQVGKLIPFKKKSKSGLRITTTIGVLQHNVRIVDDANSLPQILGQYRKGYDRLTRGLALREFIGYHHISKDRLINFNVGIEFTQGFTRHIRAVDFDTGLAPSSDLRFDGLISLKGTWILPFFEDYEPDEIFY